ncbi:MAG: hypothetical protein ACM3O3_12625 [Syntrophothermus sp.]
MSSKVLSNNFSLILDLLRGDGSIIVNKRLAFNIGLNEAILYTELISKFKYFKSRNELDSEGYYYNTHENIYIDTCLTKRQQITLFKNLEDLGLIKCKNKGVQGLGTKVRHIKIIEDFDLIMDFLIEPEERIKKYKNKRKNNNESYPQSEYIDNSIKEQNVTSKSNKKSLHKVTKSNPNNTKDNNTNFNNTNQSINQENENTENNKNDGLMDYIHEKYDIKNLNKESNSNKNIANDIYTDIASCIHHVLSSNTDIKINKVKTNINMVKSVYYRLEQPHLQYVAKQVSKVTDKINNPMNYIISCLYNSICASNLDSSNEYKHDEHKEHVENETILKDFYEHQYDGEM